MLQAPWHVETTINHALHDRHACTNSHNSPVGSWPESDGLFETLSVLRWGHDPAVSLLSSPCRLLPAKSNSMSMGILQP